MFLLGFLILLLIILLLLRLLPSLLIILLIIPQTVLALKGSWRRKIDIHKGVPMAGQPFSDTPITLSACDLHFVETK